ncbi:MAG: PD-(D/E)XK nuclease family protein, partial [Candidatus Cloacimonetes bacterium]|nr:PD-(D/E)XK nuclease family protein [Candidatus Cloacimonadota bacterium]
QDVLLYLQLPEECLDKDNLKVKADFSALHIRENRNQRIRMFRAEDQFSMIVHLLQNLEFYRPEFIVDFNPESQFYANLLSPHYFEFNNRLSLGNISLFSVVKTCFTLISRIIKEERTGKLLLPWEICLQAVSSREFRYLFDRETCPDEIWEKLQNFLQKIRQEDYLYIDLDGGFLQFWQMEPPVKELLGKIYSLLAALLRINQVIDLVSFWGNEELFYRISPPVLTSRTDLIQVYYQALADFASLEQSGILDDPAAQITQPGKQPEHIRISSALHRLFLDYLQTKEIRYNTADNAPYRFKHLHELRNLQLDSVAIINVTEGVIPPAPRSPFLLTESQRKQLGLMTFEDFKLREKYYFFRLIATSRDVALYTYHNEAEDTEVSSFLEELVLHGLIPDNFIIPVPNYEYAPVYGYFWQKENSLPVPDQQLLSDPSFYSMPFDPGIDDKNGILSVTGYGCREVREDLWRYYLNSICHLQPCELITSFDFSEKLVGILAHEILRKVWDRICKSSRTGTIQINFLHNRDQEIEAAVREIWSDPQLLYKSPHNYSELYFREIFLPVLKTGIKSLFYQMHHQLGLSGIPLEIRTETSEVTFLPLTSDTGKTYELRLSGRFDLLLQSSEGTIIIDHKTGRVNTAHNLQLAFYELLYTLNHPEPGPEALTSFIYYIEEQKLNEHLSKKTDQANRLMDFRNDLVLRLTELINRGITLPEKRGYSDLAEIERWEDYSNKILRKNATGQKDN